MALLCIGSLRNTSDYVCTVSFFLKKKKKKEEKEKNILNTCSLLNEPNGRTG